MNKEEIKDKIKKIIVEKNNIEISDVKDDSNFQTDLGLDSLDRVELTMALEKEFQVTLSDEEAEKALTVNDFTSIIEQHQK